MKYSREPHFRQRRPTCPGRSLLATIPSCWRFKNRSRDQLSSCPSSFFSSSPALCPRHGLSHHCSHTTLVNPTKLSIYLESPSFHPLLRCHSPLPVSSHMLFKSSTKCFFPLQSSLNNHPEIISPPVASPSF